MGPPRDPREHPSTCCLLGKGPRASPEGSSQAKSWCQVLVIMCPQWYTQAGGSHCPWFPSGGLRYPGQVCTHFQGCVQVRGAGRRALSVLSQITSLLRALLIPNLTFVEAEFGLKRWHRGH